MSDVSYGPWHIVRVTANWYCEPKGDELCRDPEGACNGHDGDGPGRESEREYEIEHPAECPPPPCCCTWDEPPSGGVDPNCEGGQHDECLNRQRCWTETPAAQVSPTDPDELGKWLRALPEGTILRACDGDAYQRDAGIEHRHRAPNREFPALIWVRTGTPFEISEGANDARGLAEACAPFTVLALGQPKPDNEGGDDDD